MHETKRASAEKYGKKTMNIFYIWTSKEARTATIQVKKQW